MLHAFIKYTSIHWNLHKHKHAIYQDNNIHNCKFAQSYNDLNKVHHRGSVLCEC